MANSSLGLLILGTARVTKEQHFHRKIRSLQTSFNYQQSTKSSSETQKRYGNQMTWRDNMKSDHTWRHKPFRSKYFNVCFQPIFMAGGFSQTLVDDVRQSWELEFEHWTYGARDRLFPIRAHWFDFPGVELPYCYYYLRVLCFANFAIRKKIAKLSTRKNFYQHIRHPGVYTRTNCAMIFHFGSCIIFLFWSFLPFLFFLPVSLTRARKSDVWLYRWSWEFQEWNLNVVLRSTG